MGEFVTAVICGFAIYAALGTVICMFAMLIKNNTASVIVCLCYVLFSETILSITRNLSNFSVSTVKIVGLGIRHSIYGMSKVISTTAVSVDMTIGIIINSVLIMFITTVFGMNFLEDTNYKIALGASYGKKQMGTMPYL